MIQHGCAAWIADSRIMEAHSHDSSHSGEPSWWCATLRGDVTARATSYSVRRVASPVEWTQKKKHN